MSIQLINWSGHNNLGDDAMAKILANYFGAENKGEHPSEAHWYILGGGTLISPGSLFYGAMPYPERTIGISLGVSSNWEGQSAEVLKRMKKIYTRDFFSHQKLNDYGVANVLSVDLLCYLEAERRPQTDEIWANLMYSPCTSMSDLEAVVYHTKSEIPDAKFFAMSPDEDVATIPQAKVYTDAQALLNDLAGAKKVYATRLHANVLAWVAERKIVPIAYDPKVTHFFERVFRLTPETARKIIIEHLKEIKMITT